MPLVVVNTRVVPRQFRGVNSPGEFPRSKPGTGLPPRSPAKRTRPARIEPASACASSISAQGRTAVQPAARACTIVVVARNTSMTTATLPARQPSGTNSGSK